MKRKRQPQQPQAPKELMTPEEVAAYFGVKVRRVRGWERRRVLTPIQDMRGERLYLRLEVEHLAAMYGA